MAAIPWNYLRDITDARRHSVYALLGLLDLAIHFEVLPYLV